MKRISFSLDGLPAKTWVFIDPGILSRVPAALQELCQPSSIVLITDSNVGPLYAQEVQEAWSGLPVPLQTFIVPAGEGSKSLQTASQIYDVLARKMLGRDGLIVGLGGGVVGDLAGFVAGTWMRGVPWVFCPTTVEAQVDAALGGKTGVNFAAAKNLVGVFHHPLAAVVDPECLSTLAIRDVRAGLAESIKHALLDSPAALDWHEAHAASLLALEPAMLSDLVERNLRFKGQIIAEDPHERGGRRILLNFGHTVGHAIEACAAGALRHGECVALGMLAACRISQRAGMLDAGEVERVRRILDAFGLPTRLEATLDRKNVVRALELDKKSSKGKARLVLLDGIGKPLVRDDIPPDWVGDAFDSLLSD